MTHDEHKGVEPCPSELGNILRLTATGDKAGGATKGSQIFKKIITWILKFKTC